MPIERFDRLTTDPEHRVMRYNTNFEEIACKCSPDLPWDQKPCRFITIDTDILEVFQRLRDKIGPIKITSAHRCEHHPIEQGSNARYKTHRMGLALDILVPESENAPEFRRLVLSRIATIGGGMGLYDPYPRLIHIDALRRPKNRRWPIADFWKLMKRPLMPAGTRLATLSTIPDLEVSTLIAD